jgi:hypothetical protein
VTDYSLGNQIEQGVEVSARAGENRVIDGNWWYKIDNQEHEKNKENRWSARCLKWGAKQTIEV